MLHLKQIIQPNAARIARRFWLYKFVLLHGLEYFILCASQKMPTRMLKFQSWKLNFAVGIL